MVKKKPAKPGRKAATFDYAKIEQFAGLGLDRVEIGKALGYGQTTFFKHKRNDPKIEEAILNGRAKFKINLSNILYQQAKNGNVSAAIWLDKTRCGTKEDGPENGDQTATPVQVIIQVVDASNKGTSECSTGAVPGATE